jgi:phosphatidylserine decarboxylase
MQKPPRAKKLLWFRRKPRAQRKPARWRKLLDREDWNFLLTNRIPRRLATRLMGGISKIPTGPLTGVTIAFWKLFSRDLDLSESKQRRFRSLHDCFVRELRPGARPVHRDVSTLISPCDAIVGAHGAVEGTTVFQAKGFPYRLEDLLGDPALVERYRDGAYVTLRLKASFYHRFHSPCDAAVRRVVYISGDTWNVNPIALKRVEALFTKNERAVIEMQPQDGNGQIALVAVAAILVASVRLNCLGARFNLRKRGANPIEVDARYHRGDELGWFQHGSTIVLFATKGHALLPHIREGAFVRMGEPLLARPATATSTQTETP